MTSDRIEKQVELKVPVARVWRAVTDSEEFGAWFGVKLRGPFVVGEEASGQITHPGYEHLTWRADVKAMMSETLFSFTWHPYGVDPQVDYSVEEPTLVEFLFEATREGTLLKLVESGFEAVPAGRRDEAYRMNEGGWAAQRKNIEAYLAKHA